MHKYLIGIFILLSVIYTASCKHAPSSDKIHSTAANDVPALQTAAKNLTGNGEKKPELLSEIDLAIIDIYEENRTDVVPESVMSLQLVPQAEFEEQYMLNNEFLLPNTLAIRKQNGVIKLPCKMQTVSFEDNTETDNDDYAFYSYAGQIEFLNVYVMSGSYYEAGEYFFVDKTTGETLVSFNEFPLISHDKKRIADIYFNPYSEETELNIYAIDDKREFPLLCNYFFTKWSIYNQDYFWNENGDIYAGIASTKYIGRTLKEEYLQYLRIKLNF